MLGKRVPVRGATNTADTQVSGHTGSQAASEATVSLGRLRPPLRNIALKRRGQALFPTAPASQKKRLHVTSEVCSAFDLQDSHQACLAAGILGVGLERRGG